MIDIENYKTEIKDYSISFVKNAGGTCWLLYYVLLIINRSGRPKVFYKKAYLGNLSKFTGKYLCQGLFLIKLLTFFNEIAGL